MAAVTESPGHTKPHRPRVTYHKNQGIGSHLATFCTDNTVVQYSHPSGAGDTVELALPAACPSSPLAPPPAPPPEGGPAPPAPAEGRTVAPGSTAGILQAATSPSTCAGR